MPGNPFKKAHGGGAPRVKASQAARPNMRAVRNATSSSAGAKRAPSGTAQRQPKVIRNSENPPRRSIPAVAKVKQPR